MSIADAETLNGFLYGFVVAPNVESVARNVANHGIVLFCQRCREIPGNHHIDVILVRFHFGHHFGIFWLEKVVEVETHKHLDAETASVGVRAFYPYFHIVKQFRSVLLEYLWRERVAGRPIVDIWQETVGLAYGLVKVFRQTDDECVQVVFLVVFVWQMLDELFCLIGWGELLCQFAQDGRAHAYDCILVDGWHQSGLKVAVAKVL